jgi:hypothetical protein
VNSCAERFGSRREQREYKKKDKVVKETIREWDKVEEVEVSEMRRGGQGRRVHERGDGEREEERGV